MGELAEVFNSTPTECRCPSCDSKYLRFVDGGSVYWGNMDGLPVLRVLLRCTDCKRSAYFYWALIGGEQA